MYKERALTYSVLAHIRNKATLAKGTLDIFIPLIKRVISKMNLENIHSGKNIIEIKNYSDNLYNIDFPIPVLRKLLQIIAEECNSSGEKKFILYNDDAFVISEYLFTEFEVIIKTHKDEINSLEKLFKDFCESSDIKDFKSESIFKFIEKNKYSLSRYFSQSELTNGEDFTLEAEFVDFFKKFPPLYDQLKKIYLGSLLSSYIEYNPSNVKMGVELLLDTNFILGLLDLNTPESTHTCRTLIEIACNLGYKIRVLTDTIDEMRLLLKAKSENFSESFLVKKVYPEDIYNACDRRKLSRVDLERIADNLEAEFPKYSITIIYDTTKYKNIAKYSDEYKSLKKIRSSERSAMHDAIALNYVKHIRKKNIYDFENVNCWFLNNTINREGSTTYDPHGKQPYAIKADDLLNIIWLSNPKTTEQYDHSDIADIGLASLVSLTLNDSLPKATIIQELDDNIHKYASEILDDTDIVKLASRIANKQLKDIESINKLAKTDKEEFVKRLEKEADKQKKIDNARFERLEKEVNKIIQKSEELEKIRENYELKTKNNDEFVSSLKTENKEKDETIKELKDKLDSIEKNQKLEKKDEIIDNELKKWRNKSWRELFICLLLLLLSVACILYISNWSHIKAMEYIYSFKTNVLITSIVGLLVMIFNGFVLKSLYDKYRNYSNIENFKKSIKIPKELDE